MNESNKNYFKFYNKLKTTNLVKGLLKRIINQVKTHYIF
jgi:hypothetical protein